MSGCQVVSDAAFDACRPSRAGCHRGWLTRASPWGARARGPIPPGPRPHTVEEQTRCPNTSGRQPRLVIASANVAEFDRRRPVQPCGKGKGRQQGIAVPMPTNSAHDCSILHPAVLWAWGSRPEGDRGGSAQQACTSTRFPTENDPAPSFRGWMLKWSGDNGCTFIFILLTFLFSAVFLAPYASALLRLFAVAAEPAELLTLRKRRQSPPRSSSTACPWPVGRLRGVGEESRRGLPRSPSRQVRRAFLPERCRARPSCI